MCWRTLAARRRATSEASHAAPDLARDPFTFIAVGVALAEPSGVADGEHRLRLSLF
jgi:hypothetical protein